MNTEDQVMELFLNKPLAALYMKAFIPYVYTEEV